MPAGSHEIELHLSNCEFDGTDLGGDSVTGWQSTSQRLIVEEFHAGTNAVAGESEFVKSVMNWRLN